MTCRVISGFHVLEIELLTQSMIPAISVFFGKAIIRKESYKTRFPGVESIDRPSVNVVSNFEKCPNIGGHLAAVKRLSIVMDTVMMTP